MQISLSGHNDPANDKPDKRDPDPEDKPADDDQSMSETNSDRDNGVRGYILFGSIAFAIMLLVVGGLLFMVKKRRKE